MNTSMHPSSLRPSLSADGEHSRPPRNPQTSRRPESARLHLLLLTLSAAFAAAIAPRAALAGCSPAAANGINAVCTGTTTTTYGTSFETNVNLTITPGSSISVTGVNPIAIDLGSLTLNNQGSVASNGGPPGSLAFAVYSSGDSTVRNNRSGSISASINASGNTNIYSIYSISNSTVYNTESSHILTTSSGTGTGDATGILAANSAIVINDGTSSITTIASGAQDAFGIVASLGLAAIGSVSYTGSGSLMVSSNTGSAFGILAFNNGSVFVSNSGTIAAITSGGVGNANAIMATGASSVVNTGTIVARSAGGTARAIYFGGQGDTLTLGAGSKIIGRIDLGGGPDVINFACGNNNLTFESGNLAAANFRGSAVPYAVSGDRAASLDPTPFAASTALLQAATYVIGGLTDDTVSSSTSMARSTDGLGIWGQAFGGKTSFAASGSMVGVNNSFAGGAIGIEQRNNKALQYGGFIGGLGGNTQLNTNLGDANTQMVVAGAYARFNHKGTFIKPLIQFGYGNSTSNRNTNNNLLASGIESPSGSYTTFYVSPQVSAGHSISLNRSARSELTLTPELRARYLYGYQGSYSETGGSDGLSVGSRQNQSMEERVSLKLSESFQFSRKSKLKIELNGGLLAAQTIGSNTISATMLGQAIQFAQPGSNNNLGPFGGFGLEYSSGRYALYARGEYASQVYGDNNYYSSAGVRYTF